MARIVCIGEAMLELSRRGDDWKLGYGGDTLNTAIHLSRLGHEVSYFTAVGEGGFDSELRVGLATEGLDCSLVLTHPERNVGLYTITTGQRGERSFTYWREMSAAREMFALPKSDAAIERAAEFDLLYFSLISLAILPAEGRQALLDLAGRASRDGAKVAFDGNYRPRLWRDAQEAAMARDAAIAISDIGLPTLDDELALSGAVDASAVSLHWQSLGCTECLVKLGAGGCRLPDGQVVEPLEDLTAVDTSGAGDAFNAGYLASRLDGADMAEAAMVGHRIAGWTIMRPGAIPPRDAKYPWLSA